MKLNIITLFPEIIQKHLEFLPFKKAIETNVLEVNIVNLRDFALDKYGSVDARPYGGGKGMLLRIEPIYNALESLKPYSKNSKIVILSPKGKTYDQTMAREYVQLNELTLICGRYEGIDERVTNFVDEKLSVGNYILSGGELPALIVSESITRLLEGVLDAPATQIESFADERATKVEFPQYTRPEVFKGLAVPELLLSGHHAKIEKWKKENTN